MPARWSSTRLLSAFMLDGALLSTGKPTCEESFGFLPRECRRLGDSRLFSFPGVAGSPAEVQAHLLRGVVPPHVGTDCRHPLCFAASHSLSTGLGTVGNRTIKQTSWYGFSCDKQTSRDLLWYYLVLVYIASLEVSSAQPLLCLRATLLLGVSCARGWACDLLASLALDSPRPSDSNHGT